MPSIIFYSSMIFLLAIIFIIAGFLRLKKLNLVKETPISKIRSLHMGLVEIHGKAIPQKYMKFKSPISNKDCVYYRLSVLKEGEYIFTEEKKEHFYLEDDTGSVLIDPKNAEIYVPYSFSESVGPGKEPSKKLRSIMKRLDIKRSGFIEKQKCYKFEEYIIKPGDDLYIIGTAVSNPLVGSSAKNEEMIMITKGDYNSYNYISSTDEKHMLKHLKDLVIYCFIVGVSLFALSLSLIFSY